MIAPDVGGGFGAKIGVDREVVAVAWAARQTGRPVRWVETRSENMVGMTHGRDQVQDITIGGDRDGRILAYRIDIAQDGGAYPRMGGSLPTLTSLMAAGVYDIPVVQTGFRVAVTNTTPIAAYRGAGRPEATAAIERAVDLFAAEIGMDPAEVRRRNVVPRRSSRSRRPAGPSMTPAGTPRPSARCWTPPDTTTCAPNRPNGGKAAARCSSASGSRAT